MRIWVSSSTTIVATLSAASADVGGKPTNRELQRHTKIFKIEQQSRQAHAWLCVTGHLISCKDQTTGHLESRFARRPSQLWEGLSDIFLALCVS
jgi:hypothetical protein